MEPGQDFWPVTRPYRWVFLKQYVNNGLIAVSVTSQEAQNKDNAIKQVNITATNWNNREPNRNRGY